MAKRENVIVGLDVGTTKICVVVGEIKAEGIDIIGVGLCPSKGLRKGIIVNIEGTVNAIKDALKEAELMSGVKIESVFTGIAGGHITGINSHGVIAVKNNPLNAEDIKRVIEAATAIALPADREVLHVVPQEFIVDGQGGIKDPIGMSGVRLEVKVHIVTGAVASAQNIVTACNKAGLEVKDIIIEQFASSEAILNRDEKELGVAVVDIGGGTTDIAVFNQNSIIYTGVIAIGGDLITNDIAVGLRTPIESAEIIKKGYGCCYGEFVNSDENIEVPGIGGRKPKLLPRTLLVDIVEPRVEELFLLIKREIKKSGYYDSLGSGIVLTGGTVLMEGMVELAEEVFELPVRIGIPDSLGALSEAVRSPLYSTSVGLIIYGGKHIVRREFPLKGGKVFDNTFKRMREWFKEFF